VGIISLFTRHERRKKKEYYKYLEKKQNSTSTEAAVSQVNEGKAPLEEGKITPKRASAVPWREKGTSMKARRRSKMMNKQQIFEEMNFAERLLVGIAIAFVTLGIVFGITISWIVFGPLAFVAVILLAVSFSIYFQRKKQETDLVSIVRIHGQLSLADACRLLGRSPEKIISTYLDLGFTSEEIVFEPSSSMFVAN
jgi:lipopolysaccharide export LptBFGC system permease protein LptF